MHRVRGIDPSMGELIVRVGISLPRPARTRDLREWEYPSQAASAILFSSACNELNAVS